MADPTLSVEGISHAFGRHTLFSDRSFTVIRGGVLLVTGPNGSGKSTLIRILSGLLRPMGGRVLVTWKGKTLPPRGLFHSIGMCTPEMRLYEELSGWENLLFFTGVRRLHLPPETLRERLAAVGLEEARHRMVRLYSSGMKQRLKLLLSVLHEPPILYLDEPGSNLDDRGMVLVEETIREQAERGIVILASNDTREFSYGTQRLDLAV